ncbi:DNA repair exonuclease, partial [Symbiobacterium terraclitae]|uniref:DNA repair exonuclease n=1 Tax=Symbiobacterium terraclitae TaxID=557451 RepID=UPI0035B53955
MIRILHLADLHLGWRPAFMPRDRAEERRRRRDTLLERAVDLALDRRNGIDMVVIAGDLFETHRPEEPLVAAVMGQLRRLEQGGVPVVTVPGNHDEITYPNSVYQNHREDWPGLLVTNPNPAHVASLTVQGAAVHLYSLAYTGGVTQTQPPVNRFPKVDGPGVHLAVFHGTLGDWGGDRSLPLDPAALAKAGYDYVALGHIHKPGEVRLGRGLAVYPGAVEGKG